MKCPCCGKEVTVEAVRVTPEVIHIMDVGGVHITFSDGHRLYIEGNIDALL